MIYILSLVPVFIFLLILFLLDSFKLVRTKTLLATFISGSLVAFIAYFINTWMLSSLRIDFSIYSKYIAPIIEELLKATIVIIFIRRKKIGFLIDAGIYGFAVGAGFATLENIWFLSVTPDLNLINCMIRGLGTAIMHSGTTALLSIFIIGALNAERKITTGLIPGLILACLIHSAYNHFYLLPFFQTLLILIIIPAILIFIFQINEKQLHKWLEIEFFNEAELLNSMKKGEFAKSKSGKYLASLKEHFPGEMIIDMYCLITLYLELSIKSKRNILLSECELPIIKEVDLDEKLIEFKQLRKAIGKSGELALSPLIKMNQRGLWEISNF